MESQIPAGKVRKQGPSVPTADLLRVWLPELFRFFEKRVNFSDTVRVIAPYLPPYGIAFRACRQHQSTAVLAVARGPREDAFLANPSLVLRKLRQGYRCVSWNPFAATYWTDAASLVAPSRHSLTVCANHCSSADLLQRVEQRARAMYESNAFLHWYWRHGCEEGDFEQAFETVRSVLGDYSHLGE